MSETINKDYIKSKFLKEVNDMTVGKTFRFEVYDTERIYTYNVKGIVENFDGNQFIVSNNKGSMNIFLRKNVVEMREV